MSNESNKKPAPLTDDTRKELEESRRHAEEQLRHHSQEAEEWRNLIVHLDGILGTSQKGPPDGSKNESILRPTEFVVNMLNESPDRWVSIQELLIKARIAFDARELVNRSGEIENSVHSVLSRFRKNKQVWTKGDRDTRKFKLK